MCCKDQTQALDRPVPRRLKLHGCATLVDTCNCNTDSFPAHAQSTHLTAAVSADPASVGPTLSYVHLSCNVLCTLRLQHKHSPPQLTMSGCSSCSVHAHVAPTVQLVMTAKQTSVHLTAHLSDPSHACVMCPASSLLNNFSSVSFIIMSQQRDMYSSVPPQLTCRHDPSTCKRPIIQSYEST